MPVDIEKLCRIYGAHLLPYSKAVEQSVLSWADIERMAGTRDGFTLDAGEEWAIVYNEKVSQNRMRFTFAEELMHRLLLHSQDDDFFAGHQTFSDETYGLYEGEAKRAAGMILVPPTIYYKYRKVFGTDQIAKLCGVSEPCVYTVAKFYEEHEEEIRVAFTGETILCDTRGLKRKHPLRPRAVVGESL
ncbi:MAG: ImmA/IrrE family metallo-endopeptidase [Eubacteriales bacterium]|nr:ImmA/IrrE family metallo-endopeptidase [Eubacteriales bacterium]